MSEIGFDYFYFVAFLVALLIYFFGFKVDAPQKEKTLKIKCIISFAVCFLFVVTDLNNLLMLASAIITLNYWLRLRKSTKNTSSN